MRIRSLLRFSFLLISFLLLGGTGFSFYALYSVQRDVQNIYEIRLRSTGFLLEADRDAYQSNLAGLHSIYATRKIKDIEENRDQVLQRFEKFEKLWNQTKGHKHPALTQFHDHYPAWMKPLISYLGVRQKSASKYVISMDAHHISQYSPERILSIAPNINSSSSNQQLLTR